MSLVGSYGTQLPLHMSHHHILMGPAGAHDPQYPSYYAPSTHYPPQVEASFLSPSPASSAASSPPSTDDPSAFYPSGAWCTPYCDTPSAPSASPEGGYQEYPAPQHHLGATFSQHPPLQSYRQQQQPPQSSEGGPQPFVRVVKRRNTANKKERRRTQSINTAFADLRDCIPNVPSDTKLSKIKTLRLATSYIAYLMGVLASEDPASDVGFKADIMQGKKAPGGGAVSEEGAVETTEQGATSPASNSSPSERKAKGRTGWPQHVWALELKP